MRRFGIAAALGLSAIVVSATTAAAAPEAWRLQTFTQPTGASEYAPLALACPSSTICTAVGWYDGTSGEVPLAERWTGTTWTVESVPLPAGSSGASLSGVACPSTSLCIAVGGAQGEAFAEKWNGVAWAVQIVPAPAGSELDAISCSSSTACTAVGFFPGSGGDHQTLAEAWNGTAWAMQATTASPGAITSYFDSVSCRSVSQCTAVGGEVLSSGTPSDVALAERWNGSAWVVESAASPGTNDNWLESVACPSATSCTAVGEEVTGGIGAMLAEHWNGSVWTTQTIPSPGGAILLAVRCPSTTTCFAVGQGATIKTLAEKWNGTTWAAQTTPNPHGMHSPALYAIACPSATECTAVGWGAGHHFDDLGFAEHYS